MDYLLKHRLPLKSGSRMISTLCRISCIILYMTYIHLNICDGEEISKIDSQLLNKDVVLPDTKKIESLEIFSTASESTTTASSEKDDTTDATFITPSSTTTTTSGIPTQMDTPLTLDDVIDIPTIIDTSPMASIDVSSTTMDDASIQTLTSTDIPSSSTTTMTPINTASTDSTLDTSIPTPNDTTTYTSTSVPIATVEDASESVSISDDSDAIDNMTTEDDDTITARSGEFSSSYNKPHMRDESSSFSQYSGSNNSKLFSSTVFPSMPMPRAATDTKPPQHTVTVSQMPNIEWVPDLQRKTCVLSTNAFLRTGSIFNDVLVLTDIDDTLFSSGAWTVFGKHVGGIDSEFNRGNPYPGITLLYFILAMGPHTTTPTGKRIPIHTCPMRLNDLRTDICSAEVALPLVLPQKAGTLSARASSVISKITRPPALYKDINTMLTHGARQLYGTVVKEWNCGFHSEMEFMKYFVGGQKRRGLGKLAGFGNAVQLSESSIFFGDSGEKDPECIAGIVSLFSKKFSAGFIHLVYHNRAQEMGKSSENMIPFYATPFAMNVNGVQVQAYQLVYDIETSLDRLSTDQAFEIGVKVAADVRNIAFAYLRRRLAQTGSAEHMNMHKHLPALSGLVQTPLIFVRFRSNENTKFLPADKICGCYSRQEPISSLIDSKTGLSALKMNCPLISPMAYKYTSSVNEAVDYDLGTPIIAYRSSVSAALGAFAVKMINVQDMMSVIIGTIRDLRSAGSPTLCQHRSSYTDIVQDIEDFETMMKGAANLSGYAEYSLYRDAVSAVRQFHAFHEATCDSYNSIEKSCSHEARTSIRVDTNPNASLFSLLYFGCLYNMQLEHLKSAGPVEFEDLAYQFGQALMQSMSELQHLPIATPPVSPVQSTYAGPAINVMPTSVWSYGEQPSNPYASKNMHSMSESFGIGAPIQGVGTFPKEYSSAYPEAYSGNRYGSIYSGSNPNMGNTLTGNMIKRIYSILKETCQRETALEATCRGLLNGIVAKKGYKYFEAIARWKASGSEDPLVLSDLKLVIESERHRWGAVKRNDKGQSAAFNAIGGLRKGSGNVEYIISNSYEEWQNTYTVISAFSDALYA